MSVTLLSFKIKGIEESLHFIFCFSLYIAGATLGKGLNRGLGTVLAGSLAVFIEYIAEVPGQIFQAIFIGAAIFILGKCDN